MDVTPGHNINLAERAYRIRRVFFWALVLTGTPLTFYTLADLPYDIARAGEPPQVIEAVGHQWRWALSADRVVAGREVEFRVTSADVNHGFGIYDADMRLVAQTQAMPGYTNRLRHTFARPGVYRVLCMEYCGLVHHNMVVEITATE